MLDWLNQKTQEKIVQNGLDTFSATRLQDDYSLQPCLLYYRNT